jgi:hypothetical protein
MRSLVNSSRGLHFGAAFGVVFLFGFIFGFGFICGRGPSRTNSRVQRLWRDVRAVGPSDGAPVLFEPDFGEFRGVRQRSKDAGELDDTGEVHFALAAIAKAKKEAVAASVLHLHDVEVHHVALKPFDELLTARVLTKVGHATGQVSDETK